MGKNNPITSREMQKLMAGWTSWRWLSGVYSKEKQWFLGSLMARGSFQARMSHLAKDLQELNFLSRFEETLDPWERSRLVGQKTCELRGSFRDLNNKQRAELAEAADVELKAGLELLGLDKKIIQDLVALVDPPPTL